VFERFTAKDGEVVTSSNGVTQEEVPEVRSVDAERANSKQVSTANSASFPDCTWHYPRIGKIAGAAGTVFGCCGSCSSAMQYSSPIIKSEVTGRRKSDQIVSHSSRVIVVYSLC
jgi:hypothetical protein